MMYLEQASDCIMTRCQVIPDPMPATIAMAQEEKEQEVGPQELVPRPMTMTRRKKKNNKHRHDKTKCWTHLSKAATQETPLGHLQNTTRAKLPLSERLHKLSEKLVTFNETEHKLMTNVIPHLESSSLSDNRIHVDYYHEQEYDAKDGKRITGKSRSQETSPTTFIATPKVSSITENLFLFDSETGERIHPNEMLHRIDNDVLSGYMLALMSTHDHCVKHFNGRKRKVELQFQVKFKTAPKHPLFIGCELKGSAKFSVWQRALLKAIASSIEKRNEDFRYNLGSVEESRCDEREDVPDVHDSSYICTRGPYMAMPFESSINALVITRTGDMPPTLGEAIENQTPRVTECVEFNTTDTYTFALWSANFDLAQWKCTSRSTIQPFSLNSLIGGHPFSMCLYSMDSMNHKIKKYFELEISHKLSKAGPARKAWLANNIFQTHTDTSLLDVDQDSEIYLDGMEYYPEDRNDSYHSSCMCWDDWVK